MLNHNDTCWRVPVIINWSGRPVSRSPIIYALNEEHAIARTIELYGDQLVMFNGRPYRKHDIEHRKARLNY